MINFGILPLRFKNAQDYDLLEKNDILRIERLYEQLKLGEIVVQVLKKDVIQFKTFLDISSRNVDIILGGGLLNYISHKI